MVSQVKVRPRHLVFLKDVLILTFSAFGGPQAHIALMLKMMVNDRKYLTEEEFIELNALCQMLPGPTSTQTITAIGFKRGGGWLALATLFIWFIPAVTIMSLVSLFYSFFKEQEISMSFLRFLRPMAVGFVVYATYKISKAVIKSYVGWIILAISTVITILYQFPWTFPLILLMGGTITNITSKEKANFRAERPKFVWRHLVIFAVIFVTAAVVGKITMSKPVLLFENFYRFGSLVFGGGQVLIPMMYEQFVSYKQYLTSEEFLSGFGFVQALPGPVFSFSAFTGGMAMADEGMGMQLLGSLIGAIGIFLPGTLLIFFVYPFWNYLKKYVVVKRSLEGINAAASGLVAAAAFILFNALDFSWINVAIVIVTVLLNMTKIPPPLLVVAALIAGFVF